MTPPLPPPAPSVPVPGPALEDAPPVAVEPAAPSFEDIRRPLPTLAREVAAHYFGLDGKMWRTLGPLLVRPGFLTREYLAGRRARYVRPLRLYLTASLFLFLLISVLPGGGGIVQMGFEAPAEGRPAASAEGLEGNAAALAAVRREIAELDSTRAVLVARADSLETAVAVGAVASEGADSSSFWAGLNASMEAKGAKVGAMGESEASAYFASAFASTMPKAMFLLLPLFALLLKLLYLRQRRYYGEHVVFALHTHAFAFVVFFVLLLLAAVEPDGLAGPLKVAAGLVTVGLLLAVPVYITVALRRVYGQGWGVTLAKAALLMGVYGILLTLGAVGVILLSFLLL